MPLVSYSSSSESESSSKNERGKNGHQRKRRRQESPDGTKATSAASALPPLPAAFHDLYASTVRQSVVDDPKLHQGRKRQTPHIVGQWPSHLYIEWHPTSSQLAVLNDLMDQIEKEMGSKKEVHRLLASDLGSPLPLHISLSRPLSLSTAEKDEFLERVTDAIGNSGLETFTVNPKGLAWFKSPDSDRAFLIIRVDSEKGRSQGSECNPELMSLLNSCNAVAGRFKKPLLYQVDANDDASGAFHLSIAWTFGLPHGEKPVKVLDLCKGRGFREATSWKVEVSGIKAKIGNVVNHIPLASAASRKAKSGVFMGGQ